ncbi:MAG: hypothetical protein RJA36_1782 [Pseudomonadota bacterium]
MVRCESQQSTLLMPLMETRRVLLIQGHPDAGGEHLCHALAQAYAAGARSGGHALRQIDVARLDFPLLRSQAEWEHGALPAGLQSAQDDIRWAQHLVLVFPLWLGEMPALLKAFLEQVARPGFAFGVPGAQLSGHKGLAGRSARLIVTMGMPAAVYRWYFLAHGVRSLERSILDFVGISPVRESFVGLVDRLGTVGVLKWERRLQALGQAAS